MKKIIAISANTSWYLFNFRKNTIKALLEQGYSVIAIAPYDDYSLKLEHLGAHFIQIDIDQGGTNPIKDFKTICLFYRIFSKNNIDVLLNFTPKNNIYATLAASRFNIKVINNIAGLGLSFSRESITTKIARKLYRISQHYSDWIFFQNEEDREIFVQNRFVSKNITSRLPGSGVDLSRFMVTPSVDDGVVRFLLIARMLYQKGIEQYVNAARNLKKIYGDGVEFRLLGFLDTNNPSAVTKEKMDQWVSEGCVKYLGVSDNVEEEIAKIDCMVLPSFYREGVPKTLLEACAMGKPIVTTDNVGCRETVDENENGFLCQPQDDKSLEIALQKIITMGHESRLSMGMKSRYKVEKEFDEKIVIDQYLLKIKEFLTFP